ncbi:hypothetical protein F3Y22_tig00110505pilonHSYRG00443 [Hibiscus syriacus]|uniref:Uncharacterized protein n=1 Tax=Hibiscus syriacus TaxID=106335 RepID=A0A6A3ABI6_HIBSY|nr:hypothetical protein F3Y22_tig00110505pilonHSYRG00443 [Hibiscus syriacus]
MGNPKRELLSKAPWRVEEDQDKFADAKLRLPISRAPPPKYTSLAASPPFPKLTTMTPSRLTLNSVTASSATSRSFSPSLHSVFILKVLQMHRNHSGWDRKKRLLAFVKEMKELVKSETEFYDLIPLCG